MKSRIVRILRRSRMCIKQERVRKISDMNGETKVLVKTISLNSRIVELAVNLWVDAEIGLNPTDVLRMFQNEGRVDSADSDTDAGLLVKEVTELVVGNYKKLRCIVYHLVSRRNNSRQSTDNLQCAAQSLIKVSAFVVQ